MFRLSLFLSSPGNFFHFLQVIPCLSCFYFYFFLLAACFGRRDGGGERRGSRVNSQSPVKLVEFSWVVHRYDCFLERWCFVRKVSGANKKVPFFFLLTDIYIYEALSLPFTLPVLDPSLHFIYFIYLSVFSVRLSIHLVC